ncbi:MAG TPA: hypothetical protein VF407_09875 [Polyangiaceae bacterium]
MLALGAAACASILGIEDGKLDPNAVDGGIQICTADSGVQVDTSKGVFVSVEVGEDSDSCGADFAPCKTIKTALTALTSGKSIIYLATSRHTENTYNESVTLPSNVELQGGWTILGSPSGGYQWQQVCQDQLGNREQIANIIGTDNFTVRAQTGSVALTNLYIGSRAAKPGESMIGILASGQDTSVTLTHVLVDTAQGGNGAIGTTGDTGDDAPDGSACAFGNGMTPDPGDAGTAAGPTTYSDDGVHPAQATGGAAGQTGGNGTRPEDADAGCFSYVNCGLGSIGCSSASTSACGVTGSAGCGGSAGAGGGPGQSGGSSVGVFAADGATIVVALGGITVHGGGKGGNGGPGGAGGKGALGASGKNGDAVHRTCGDCNVPEVTESPKGTAGTQGASGSAGGTGGGGAGGDSFAFVNLDASISYDASIDHGKPGDPGLPLGAGGQAKDIGP